jgi:hypothetical protein
MENKKTAKAVNKPAITENNEVAEVKNQEVQPPVIEVNHKPEQVSNPADQPEKILSMEEKLLNFLKERPGYFRINDFLKSLYRLKKFNEPQEWTYQSESKRVRNVLSGLKQAGKIEIMGDSHINLGKVYYEGEGQLARVHNIGTVAIEARYVTG